MTARYVMIFLYISLLTNQAPTNPIKSRPILRQDLEGWHHIEMFLQEQRHGTVTLLALLGQLHREVLGATQAWDDVAVIRRAWSSH